MKSIRTIDVADLDDIAIGGAILGTGGGGDPYIGKLMAQQAIRRHGPVRLVDVDDFDDDALDRAGLHDGRADRDDGEAAAGRGDRDRFAKAREIPRPQGRWPCCAARPAASIRRPRSSPRPRPDLPLIDGDGMGRAFPELQMTTFGMHGVSATPMVLSDDKGNSVVLETISNRWTERLARSCTVDMGGSALLAFYPMSGAVAKKAVVRGTLSLCADLGRKLGRRVRVMTIRSRRSGRRWGRRSSSTAA